MNYQFPVTFDQDVLSQYREELEWTHQEIEMLAISLERHPGEMTNVEQLRQIIQESLMSAEKLDLAPVIESLSDVLKGIDLLLDWQVYPVNMTEYVLALFDRVMLIAKEIEETQNIDMRKTQTILVSLQSIILARDATQIEQGIKDALLVIEQETIEIDNNASEDIDIELFGDDQSDSVASQETEIIIPPRLDIFVPDLVNNPLLLARDFIENSQSESCMIVLNNLRDNEIQHTHSHTKFMLELALAINFYAGYVNTESLFSGICLHDIAISANPRLLQKKDLTEEELNELKMHPVRSAEIAHYMCGREDVEWLILHHHEHIDGSGYPFGLKGDAISELGKLAAIVGSFHDTMENNRQLRPKMRVLRAIAEINLNAGKLYDPLMTKDLNTIMRKCWLEDWNNSVAKAA